MRAEFIARRALMVDGLNAIAGVSCVMPHGAFYTFPNVSSYGRTSAEIADHLLYDAGVCGLAGTAFGRHGEGHLRFSYANSREKLLAALERIGESLATLERTGELAGASSGAPRWPAPTRQLAHRWEYRPGCGRFCPRRTTPGHGGTACLAVRPTDEPNRPRCGRYSRQRTNAQRLHGGVGLRDRSPARVRHPRHPG
jgi:hypothetical protein